jgi:hypothetical protein
MTAEDCIHGPCIRGSGFDPPGPYPPEQRFYPSPIFWISPCGATRGASGVSSRMTKPSKVRRRDRGEADLVRTWFLNQVGEQHAPAPTSAQSRIMVNQRRGRLRCMVRSVRRSSRPESPHDQLDNTPAGWNRLAWHLTHSRNPQPESQHLRSRVCSTPGNHLGEVPCPVNPGDQPLTGQPEPRKIRPPSRPGHP